jgi:small GTP-binding protein
MNRLSLMSKKVCMLGSYGVGKSSIVRQFVYGKFETKYLTTIGVHFSHKMLAPSENEKNKRSEPLKLVMWDLSHLEKLGETRENYIGGAHAAIAVFDLSRPKTVGELDAFISPFMDLNPEAKIILVGNKNDLVSETDHALDEIDRLRLPEKQTVIFTSAKKGKNVHTVFAKLRDMLVNDE